MALSPGRLLLLLPTVMRARALRPSPLLELWAAQVLRPPACLPACLLPVRVLHVCGVHSVQVCARLSAPPASVRLCKHVSRRGAAEVKEVIVVVAVVAV